MFKRYVSIAGILAALNCVDAQAQSPTIAPPAIVVNVEDMKSLGLNSTASYSLFNGADAVSINSSGDITVNRSTEIRFLVTSGNTEKYSIIGISFVQTDANKADPVGLSHFPVRNLSSKALVVKAEVEGGESNFKYSIVFQRESDGTLGIIDPQIRNGGGG